MPLAPSRAVLWLILALCACLLCSCTEERLPSGVVAEVNGRHVTLRALNTVLDSREMSYAAVPQVETLQREYGKVLAAYILYMLVDEEMTRRGTGVSDAELDALVDVVRRDYPEGGFAEVVKEQGIDMAEWRLLLRYQRNLELFCSEVLLPRGEVREEDVKAWFADNAALRHVPERANVRLLQAATNDALKQMCARGAPGPDAPLPEGVTLVRGITFTAASLLAQKEGKPLFREKAPGACSEIVPQDGAFTVLVLDAILPPADLSMEEMYAFYLENALGEAVHDELMAWLEERLQTARVRVSSRLAPGFAAIMREALEEPRVPELVGPLPRGQADRQIPARAEDVKPEDAKAGGGKAGASGADAPKTGADTTDADVTGLPSLEVRMPRGDAVLPSLPPALPLPQPFVVDGQTSEGQGNEDQTVRDVAPDPPDAGTERP